MAKLVLNGSTSGSVTLDVPAVAGTTTLTFPATTGTVITTAANQTLTTPTIAQINSASTNVPPILADSAGNTASVRAWVNFNSNSGSGVIRASFNVSSVTVVAAGNYTVNYTNALPDVNYCVLGCVGSNGTLSGSPVAAGIRVNAMSTTSCTYFVGYGSTTTGNDFFEFFTAIR